MRKDIEIHIDTGDMVISPTNKVQLRPFSWVSNETGLTRYIYGEIQIPGGIPEADIKADGVYLSVPYTPRYKEFYIRIRRTSGGDLSDFVQNPVDGSEWFLARAGLYGGEMENVYASQLVLISEDRFYVKLNGGFADIYSGNESDVRIVPADRQNSNMLLKCLPTNNYRYPLTGVGLVRWLNSNVDHVKLSEVLQREFEADGAYVKNASFDLDSKNLLLDTETYDKD
jgi:hypothetical protein